MVVANCYECFDGQCQRSNVKGKRYRNGWCMHIVVILVIMTMRCD